MIGCSGKSFLYLVRDWSSKSTVNVQSTTNVQVVGTKNKKGHSTNESKRESAQQLEKCLASDDVSLMPNVYRNSLKLVWCGSTFCE